MVLERCSRRAGILTISAMAWTGTSTTSATKSVSNQAWLRLTIFTIDSFLRFQQETLFSGLSNIQSGLVLIKSGICYLS